MDSELKYLIEQIERYMESLQYDIRWFLKSGNRIEDLYNGVYSETFNYQDFRDMYYMCLALRDKIQHG